MYASGRETKIMLFIAGQGNIGTQYFELGCTLQNLSDQVPSLFTDIHMKQAFRKLARLLS